MGQFSSWGDRAIHAGDRFPVSSDDWSRLWFPAQLLPQCIECIQLPGDVSFGSLRFEVS